MSKAGKQNGIDSLWQDRTLHALTVAFTKASLWQTDCERRACLRCRGDRYCAPVGDDDLAHDVQPQTKTARHPPRCRFRRGVAHERIEDLSQHRRRDRWPFIVHAQDHG